MGFVPVSLFRSEIAACRSNRLSGNASIAIPLAWYAIATLIFGSLISAIAFISAASYARVETVTGAIVPDTGVSLIVPTRNGVIATLPVREGQLVATGTTLASPLYIPYIPVL
jgi:membrane fusion protein